MDENLLKRTVQGVEMPEDMKERIIANCKSGEAKPLILPKKRFVYLPIAAAACVCLLVAAAAGMGVWRMSVLSQEGGDVSIMPNESDGSGTSTGKGVYVDDISDRIINIIPLTNEDVAAAQDEVDLRLDDYKMYSDEQLEDYFGIDLTSLSGIFPDVMLHWGPEDPDGKGVYSTDNGIYYDRNTYLYVDERTKDKSFRITASRLGIPNSVEKLWSDEEMRSRIDGTTVAIGKWQDMTVYEAEFITSASTYFHITARSSVDELATFITAIIEKTEQYLNGTPLTLDKLLEICSGDCSKLSWSDFRRFESQDIGSGLYILYYDIEGKYSLTIGGVPDEEPRYMRFAIEGEHFIDIREESIEDYLKKHTSESSVNNTAKLIWPTDGGFISEWGYWDGGYSGHIGVDIAGIESGAPVYAGADGVVTFSGWSGGLGWYVEIEHPDLGISSLYAHNSATLVSIGQQVTQGELIAAAGSSGVAYGTHLHIEVKVDGENVNPKNYLSQPVYGSDIITVIPITQADITYSYHDSDVTFIEGDQVPMTDRQLSEYYGIDITAFGNIPSDMTLKEYQGSTSVKGRKIWKKDGGTGEVYYDLNAFSYNNADNSRGIMITVGTIGDGPVGTLFEDPQKFSVIGGRNVVIGYTEDRRFYARFVSEDCVLGVQVEGDVTLEELHSIISALVEQTEVRDYGQSTQNGAPLTLEKLKELWWYHARSWDDYKDFAYTQTGIDYVVRSYDIEGVYTLTIIGNPKIQPEHMYFSHKYAAPSERTDLLTQDLNAYLSYYEDKANQVQEKGEKESAFAALELREDLYEKAWHEYSDIPFGENHLPALQTIDAAEPDMRLAAIAYAATGKGITLPKAPVSDTVNVIPVSTVAAAAFWERSIYMDNSGFSLHSVMPDNHYDKHYSLLDDYYGVTVQPEVPSYMERQNDNYGFYTDESGEVYLDVNVIRFVSNEHFKVYRDGAYGNVVLTVEVMKDGIPDYSPEFWNRPELLSDINGVTVAIGQVSEYDYAAEFMVGDVGFHITSASLSLDKLTEVISSLTAQYAGHVKETYENYQDSGEGEFIGGVQRVVKESATVEEMYQALEKFDTEGRIDKILISFDGRPVTEGRLVQGLNFEVYYDNEASWFIFQY